MANIQENNKRLARNTVLLYVRMFLTMIVSLYTSRVVLQVLGVEDYGIYAVTGGFVAMLSFINNSIAGSTSRFITYEIGGGNIEKTRDTFCMAFYEHLGIAILILMLAETIGLWFLNNKMVIPESRLFAANCVYQMSVLSVMVSITQTPYMACVMAHEKMNIYAYVEMLNVSLKLGVVYILLVGEYDKLILYASLMLIVSILIAMIYRVYCIRQFKESHLRKIWDKEILLPMLSFSGWDFYGHLSDMARSQGVMIVQNLFFGPIVNAAGNIAGTVQGTIVGFASNVSLSVKPQIIKYYAEKEYGQMVHLTYNACKVNALLLMLPTIPLLMELHYVMNLWLHEVPEYAITFCSFGLLFNMIGCISSVLTTGVQATGNIRLSAIIRGTLYVAVVPFSYLSFKMGASPWIAYLFNVIAIFIGMVVIAYIYQYYVKDFKTIAFVVKVFLPCSFIFVVGVCWCLIIQMLIEESFFRLVLVTMSSMCLTAFVSYYYIIPSGIKLMINSFLINKVQLIINRLRNKA